MLTVRVVDWSTARKPYNSLVCVFGGFENVLRVVDIRAIPVYFEGVHPANIKLLPDCISDLLFSLLLSHPPPPSFPLPFSTPSFPPQSSPVLVGFEQAEYQTSEGSVELCFNTSAIIPKPFTVNLTTSDITAIGTYTLYVYSMGGGGGEILSNSWSVPGPFS